MTDACFRNVASRTWNTPGRIDEPTNGGPAVPGAKETAATRERAGEATAIKSPSGILIGE
jgi:hypothetical protein